MFIEGAGRHCPDEWGNSTVDGYYGCPDLDGDGIADLYDDNIEIGDPNSEEPNPLRDDGDGDGILMPMMCAKIHRQMPMLMVKGV